MPRHVGIRVPDGVMVAAATRDPRQIRHGLGAAAVCCKGAVRLADLIVVFIARLTLSSLQLETAVSQLLLLLLSVLQREI